MDAGGVTFSGTCGLMHWVKLLGVLTLLSLKCSGFITSMEGSEGESGLDRPCFAPPPHTHFCLGGADSLSTHGSVLGYIMEDPSTGSGTGLNIIH